jgi:energy-coupling factor transport system ATP-binding protein
MGPTGAGKTTFCHHLNGLIPHSIPGTIKGSVSVDGIDTKTSSVPDLARKVGMTFQDLESTLFGLTVEEEIAFGPENLGLPVEEVGERIESALDVVRMSEYRFRSPSELSGGQKQRVAIAGALALRPEILVMDEPTSELDPIGKREIFSVVETLRDKYGITIILVEHEAEQIARFADRVLLIVDGTIVEDESPQPFFTKILENENRRIRCPQVSELAHLLRTTGAWRWDIPVKFDEALTHVREIITNTDCMLFKMASETVESRESEHAIEVRNLSFKYPSGVDALRGINLDISKGEIVAVIGQNGSGKTTLVKHFNGLLKPSAGSVKVFGKETSGLRVSELSKTVGYIFQNPDHQIFCETVEEEVAYGPRNLGMNEGDVKSVVNDTLAFMGLEKLRNEHPFSLGKGERKLVALCSVLSMNTDVLVIDEPTTGQDYVNTIKISDSIKRIHEEGKTVILVTHDMKLVASVAPRTIVMMQGMVLADTSTRSAFEQTEMLSQSFIEPPQIVSLSNALKKEKFPICLDPSEMFKVMNNAMVHAH